MADRAQGIGTHRVGITVSPTGGGMPAQQIAPRQAAPVGDAVRQLLYGAAGVAQGYAGLREAEHGLDVKTETNMAVKAFTQRLAAPEFTTQEAHDYFYRLEAFRAGQEFDPEALTFNPTDTPGDVLDGWVDARSTEMPDIFKAELFRHVAPKFAAWHGKKIREQRILLVDEGNETLAGQWGSERDFDALEKATATAIKLNATLGRSKADVLRDTAVRGLDAAAAAGNVERAKKIGAYIDDTLPGIAERGVQTAIRTRRIRDDRAKADAAEAMTEEILENDRKGAKLSDSLAAIDKAADENTILETAAITMKSRLVEAHNAGVVQQQRQATYDAGAAAMDRGLGGLLTDQHILKADGTTTTVSAKENIRRATAAKFAALDRQDASANAALAAGGSEPVADSLARKVRYIEENGLVHKPWSMMFDAAFRSAGVLDAKDANPETVARVVQSYEFWRRLKTINPALANQHLDGDTAKFFALADLAYRHVTPGEAVGALRAAHAAIQNPAGVRVDPRELDEAVRDITQKAWSDDISNAGDMQGVVRNLANFYISSLGVGASAAVEEAVDNVEENYTEILGRLVYTRNVQLPLTPEAIFANLRQQYYDSHPGEVEDVDNLSFIFTNNGAVLQLVNTELNRMVEDRDAGVCSVASLRSMAMHVTAEEVSGAIASVKKGMLRIGPSPYHTKKVVNRRHAFNFWSEGVEDTPLEDVVTYVPDVARIKADLAKTPAGTGIVYADKTGRVRPLVHLGRGKFDEQGIPDQANWMPLADLPARAKATAGDAEREAKLFKQLLAGEEGQLLIMLHTTVDDIGFGPQAHAYMKIGDGYQEVEFPKSFGHGAIVDEEYWRAFDKLRSNE